MLAMLKLVMLLGAGAALAPAMLHSVALSKAAGGLWEIGGVPDSKAPVRQCIADIAELAQFEHRGRPCSRSIIDDSSSSVTIQYSCGAAGFGRSQVDVITPRSLRISTQGISGGLPFNYVLQARRIGECMKNPASSSH